MKNYNYLMKIFYHDPKLIIYIFLIAFAIACNINIKFDKAKWFATR